MVAIDATILTLFLRPDSGTPIGAEAKRIAHAAALKTISELQKHSAFRIEAFDTRPAIELAMMTRDSLRRGRKQENSTATWAKLKFDQQIVATARVHQATVIYSDDEDIRAIAKRVGIDVVGVADLALPPEAAQMGLELDAWRGTSQAATTRAWAISFRRIGRTSSAMTVATP